MIVVTGATGSLGSLTVEALLDLVPATSIVASVRDPQHPVAAAFAERGVDVRRADFGDTDSLVAAFTGASTVLVTSVDQLGRQDLNLAAARAAADAGADRVFYTAHQNTRSDSPVGFAPDHAATEELLAAIGVPWTSLRNGFYAHTVGFLVGGALQTGELALPADGPVSWTAREDLAAGAAVLLAAADSGDGPVFEGPTPPLTATEAVTFDDVARILSDITGTTVRRTVVDDEEWLARSVAAGMPEHAAQFMLGMFTAARAGHFDEVSPVLAELTGRPTTPLRTVLERTLARP